MNHINPVITYFSSLLLVFVLLDLYLFILKPVSLPSTFKAENTSVTCYCIDLPVKFMSVVHVGFLYSVPVLSVLTFLYRHRALLNT
jgi:hypothetical protein